MQTTLLLLAFAVAWLVAGTSEAVEPAEGVRDADQMLVMSSFEDAGGTTQVDLDMQVLQMLERRSVELLEAKTRAYLKAQGKAESLPKFRADSHYVQAGKAKLAIVHINVPSTVNQVFIYGIKGAEFRRVACVRTVNFSQAIPLFYGLCGEKIREVFGVSINPTPTR